jgi:putative transposase
MNQKSSVVQILKSVPQVLTSDSTNVVGIFPNDASIRRLVGALMLEQNDEWAVTRRYMTLETVAAICEDNTMDPAKIAAL